MTRSRDRREDRAENGCLREACVHRKNRTRPVLVLFCFMLCVHLYKRAFCLKGAVSPCRLRTEHDFNISRTSISLSARRIPSRNVKFSLDNDGVFASLSDPTGARLWWKTGYKYRGDPLMAYREDYPVRRAKFSNLPRQETEDAKNSQARVGIFCSQLSPSVFM